MSIKSYQDKISYQSVCRVVYFHSSVLGLTNEFEPIKVNNFEIYFNWEYIALLHIYMVSMLMNNDGLQKNHGHPIIIKLSRSTPLAICNPHSISAEVWRFSLCRLKPSKWKTSPHYRVFSKGNCVAKKTQHCITMNECCCCLGSTHCK